MSFWKYKAFKSIDDDMWRVHEEYGKYGRTVNSVEPMGEDLEELIEVLHAMTEDLEHQLKKKLKKEKKAAKKAEKKKEK